MSRIAKNPIVVPSNVEVTINLQSVTIKGKQGILSHQVHPDIRVEQIDGQLKISEYNNNASSDAIAGTTRAILNNMVIGVNQGFEKKLQLLGVGYRAQAQGKVLNLSLGFSHPIEFAVPSDVTVETPAQTDILIKGIDKQKVGQVAAKIRAYRPPEPYKGKGIRYANEKVILKEAKKK